MTSHSQFQNNVLAKFVDATCIFRDAGAAVGQWSGNRVEGNGNVSKTKKTLQFMFVSVINNVDLKNNDKNYRKSF